MNTFGDAFPEVRILDFDIETVAAGYADPSWVPDKITCVAWSWVGDDRTPSSAICGKLGYFEPRHRKEMLEKFLPDFLAADVVTGHNIIRFDLPVLNAECLRLGLPPLPQKWVEDTIRLPKTKGFKKGQDALAVLFGAIHDKLPLNWQEWELAYEEDGWPTVIERCVGDVLQHKELRHLMVERGIKIKRTLWRP